MFRLMSLIYKDNTICSSKMSSESSEESKLYSIVLMLCVLVFEFFIN